MYNRVFNEEVIMNTLPVDIKRIRSMINMLTFGPQSQQEVDDLRNYLTNIIGPSQPPVIIEVQKQPPVNQ